MPGPAYQRGWLLYDARRYAMAADEFTKELGENPKSGYAWSMLALSRLYDKKPLDALRDAQSAVAAEPNLAFAHYVIATVLIRQPGVDQPPFFRPLGLFRKKVTNDYRTRVRFAFPPALEAVRLDPQNAGYRWLLAAMEFDLGRTAEALMWANSGLELDPEHLDCTNIRAKVLARMGHLESANDSINSALRINPNSAAAHATRGWNLLKGGDSKEAVEAFANAARLDPNNAQARSGLKQSLIRRRWYMRPFAWLESRIGRQLSIVITLAALLGLVRLSVEFGALVAIVCVLSELAVVVSIAVAFTKLRQWRQKRRAIKLGQWPPKVIVQKSPENQF